MSSQHVLITARLSRLCVHFYKKLDNLLDRLSNRSMMNGSQNDALEWACGNQNDARCYSRAMLHELQISHSSCTDNHLVVLLSFLPRVRLPYSSLTINGRQERH
jgi:hypothetical protein